MNELYNRPALSFLDWKSYESDMDTLSSQQYADYQYKRGLTIGHSSQVVHISVRNVWGAVTKEGQSIQSYETIGYHAHTAQLLRGFIDSDVKIVVWRDHLVDEIDNSYRITDTIIQE